MTHTAVSLFSGAGGMDLGFEGAGFDIVLANEMDKQACQSYRANFDTKLLEGDIKFNMGKLGKVPNVSVVFGGPPCQG